MSGQIKTVSFRPEPPTSPDAGKQRRPHIFGESWMPFRMTGSRKLSLSSRRRSAAPNRSLISWAISWIRTRHPRWWSIPPIRWPRIFPKTASSLCCEQQGRWQKNSGRKIASCWLCSLRICISRLPVPIRQRRFLRSRSVLCCSMRWTNTRPALEAARRPTRSLWQGSEPTPLHTTRRTLSPPRLP